MSLDQFVLSSRCCAALQQNTWIVPLLNSIAYMPKVKQAFKALDKDL